MKNTFTFILFITFYFGSYAQNKTGSWTLQQLQARFTHKNYTEKVLLDFQKTMVRSEERPQLNEDIPGEVISWTGRNGDFSWHETYLIQKNKVQNVELIPKDNLFFKKLNSYASGQSKFSYGADLWSFAFVEKKLKDNFYLIGVVARSFSSMEDIITDDILIYDLKYKTRDFKEFKLVRFKDSRNEEWKEVGEY
ncbi:hypothetical protein [Flavobacterium panacagri]|uniref:hypothetical protein n=1 Tax=Flavobacterium panacagri TaxID=3034146 RepID=UPI0025A5C31A|nr:hypothetical protein [Flavobacterium panacagri]